MNEWYGIKEACNNINSNPQEYCRLTDNMIYEVLRLRDDKDKELLVKYPDLQIARRIMRDIQARNIYKFVSDAGDLDVQE